MQNNQRKYTRYSFSSAENINAFCHYSKDGELRPFHVANISKGGMGIITSKDIIKTITTRQILSLNHITGNRHLEFMKNLKLEVRWILNSKIMGNIGIGCGYNAISNSMAEQISDFIEIHADKTLN